VARARAPFLYAGPVRQALIRLKFGGERAAAQALAPFMAAELESAPPAGPEPAAPARPFAVVTWVPLGHRRRRARTFDQAEALARAVGALAGLPVVRMLGRRVETDPQARRPGAERRRALRGAFRAIRMPPGSVLLVDDVLTSGATAAACAEELVAAGAVEVALLTAARSLGGPLPARCYDRAGSGLGLWLPGGRLR
jgi:predicted amidophosphoribosyltransferase